jgi:tetratricopeptide (TPR) repeat protein
MTALALLAVFALAAAQERVEGPNAISLPSRNPLVTEADAHYSRRQDGRVGAMANPREIAQAVAGYDRASEAPDNAETRWTLARALYFQAAYTGQDAEAQSAIYEKARRVGEEAVRILERRAKGRGVTSFEGRSPADVAATVLTDPDAAPTFFWTSVAWGQWALASGKMKAARTGAAEKIRDGALTVIALDPEFEEGGGYRLLGRLHHQAPKVPFLTSWVSRDKALENLRHAVTVNERNFANRHFLAEALADGGPAERAEAVRIEEAVVADAPSPGHLVEDLSIQEDAKRNLAKWKAAR